jgi:hypothetical protein
MIFSQHYNCCVYNMFMICYVLFPLWMQNGHFCHLLLSQDLDHLSASDHEIIMLENYFDLLL